MIEAKDDGKNVLMKPSFAGMIIALLVSLLVVYPSFPIKVTYELVLSSTPKINYADVL
jgi:hypothetical protein